MDTDSLQAMQAALAEELTPGFVPIPTLTGGAAIAPNPTPDEAAWHLVQDYTAFSRSLIWDLQKRFFEEKGASAWSEGIVPHYVTSNAFIARSYARVALGYLRDVAHRTPGQCVHLVELGAGVGQFSFHFLHALVQSYDQSTLPGKVRFRYVMTDLAQENVDFWQQHPRLSDWVERGVLDFARFDVTADQEVQLQSSGDLLSPADPPGPIFLIANYLFDTIPQDLFRIENGQLLSSQLRLRSRQPVPSGPADPALLPHLSPHYRHLPLEETEPYAEPVLNQVLAHYHAEFDGCSILFPMEAIRCLERFRTLSGGRLFLLSADKGYLDEQAVREFGLPGLAHHGSFSLMVNYHALGLYAEQQAGEAWFRHRAGSSITVCGFDLDERGDLPETRLAYEQAQLSYGPDDYFQLKGGMERNFEHFEPRELLAYLRMAGYDPKALRRILPYLVQAASRYEQGWAADFRQMLPQVMANYYPIGEASDLEREVERLCELLG